MGDDMFVGKEKTLFAGEESENERVDLADLAGQLEARFRGAEPRGYLRGKTQIRDCVMSVLKVSAADAELLVDEMSARGFIRYTGDPSAVDHGEQPWSFNEEPLSVS